MHQVFIPPRITFGLNCQLHEYLVEILCVIKMCINLIRFFISNLQSKPSDSSMYLYRNGNLDIKTELTQLFHFV